MTSYFGQGPHAFVQGGWKQSNEATGANSPPQGAEAYPSLQEKEPCQL